MPMYKEAYEPVDYKKMGQWDSYNSNKFHREIRTCPTGLIKIPDHFRSFDQAVVEQLKESIKTEGLLQPIGVREIEDPTSPYPNKLGYELLWGRHRLEAFRQLLREEQLKFTGKTNPWATTPILQVSGLKTDDDAMTLTILENLVRNELSAKEKDEARTQLATLRKAHGLTKDLKKAEQRAIAREGKTDKGTGRRTARTPSTDTRPSTAEDVAKLTGVSPRAVQVSVQKTIERARAVDPAFDPDKKLNVAEAEPEQLKQAVDLSKQYDTTVHAPVKPKPTVVEDQPYKDLKAMLDKWGVDKWKDAINRVWKEQNPAGRVVFNTTHGAGDDPLR